MANELKGTIINMKSLSQDIKDPIIVGGGESEGRFLTIIFTQQAAAQFSDNTIVYLSWRHIQKNVKGYNAFKKFEYEDTDEITAEEQPPTWYIYYPKELLHEGDVIANIELVDDISVAASVNFSIHVLADPWAGTKWIEQDDLSEFKTAMNKASTMEDRYDELLLQIEELKKKFGILDYEDENHNGINDVDETNVSSGELTITEWTGE